MSEAATDQFIEDKVAEFDRLTSGVEDAEVRNQLRREFIDRLDSSLTKKVVRTTLENRDLRRGLSEDTYRRAGIPEKSYRLVAESFEGDHLDTDAVRAYGQQVGLVPTEPKPGDPDYVWSSPAERRAYEEGNENE